MKQLEELDPSAVDSIEFNIKSVKKYTSLFTIVLSILIIVLSIAINADSLSEIYAPRSQLPVTAVKFKQTSEKFTDQPICITYLPNQTVSANAYIRYKIGETQTYGNKSIPQDSTLSGFSYMKKYIGQNGYQCFNLKGISIQASDEIRLNGDFPAETRVYIGSHSIQTIQNQKEQNVIQLEGSEFLISQIAIRVLLSTNIFILKQKLQVNYSPQVIYTFNNRMLKNSVDQIGIANAQLRISFQDNYISQNENYIGTSYTITRRNIAEILGNVLAWRGLILIPIAIMLMLFPIVEKFYKYDLIKARLDSDVINNANFNIFTDIKRRLSGFCPNRFREQRVIDKAIDKIDDELDLINILQLQTVMRKQRAEFNQIQREEDIFDCKIQQKDTKKDVLLEGIQVNNNLNTRASIAIANQHIFSKNESSKKSKLLSLLESFIYTFDDTETNVSISTNQGKGYGSIWSLLSFVLLTAAIVTMLLLLGVFNILPESMRANAYALDQSEQEMTLPSYHLAVRVFHPFLQVSPKAFLVNGNDENIASVDIVNDERCSAMVLSNNMVSSNWFCVSSDIFLSAVDGNVINLKIVPTYRNPTPEGFKIYGSTEILLISELLEQKNVAEYHSGYQGSSKNCYKLKKIVKFTDDVRQDGFELQQVQRVITTSSYSYFSLSDAYVLEEDQTGSYWDIFNNTWGIVIIACDLLLFRVGRMINLKIISSRVNTEKQQKRSDILTVLFDIDRLSKGIYKEQLSSVGFYYKHKLPIDS